MGRREQNPSGKQRVREQRSVVTALAWTKWWMVLLDPPEGGFFSTLKNWLLLLTIVSLVQAERRGMAGIPVGIDWHLPWGKAPAIVSMFVSMMVEIPRHMGMRMF
ncbi:hypothetical protein MKZ38_001330 [Zalerion maritima]|uniref:Uncharacterized protein n=1 Tax=Zalerion maritima TaxID=339359 RepID=A0AAD5WRJ8_9PEZI|nr:hypothetical protein MKZ38_001330 [Zalerion maritima]